MTGPGTLFSELSEKEQKRTKRTLRKTIKGKFDKLYKELESIHRANTYEWNNFGRVSPDNEQRMNEIHKKMIALSREMVP